VPTRQPPTRSIPEAAESRNPIEVFEEWYREAALAGLPLPEAAALGTATPDGQPSVRMILLKGVESRGFVFFTNYESRKAVELAANPRAALTFHWPGLERQVRVEGRVKRITRKESAAYFETRPRGSRIGAWASHQSQPLGSRGELEERVRHFEEKYPDEVPLPRFWGGYVLRPVRIELWQGRPDRLHERLLFERRGTGWSALRLYP
jgi:pyridoxamine 5'-phosphate oxidase